VITDAVLVVDKPAGITSFDVVRKVRRAARTREVGHGGTLDPLASGVLPICLGEATKLAQFLLDADKAYEVTIRLGVETDTDDADGTVTRRADASAVDRAAIEAALTRFRGPQQQVPPGSQWRRPPRATSSSTRWIWLASRLPTSSVSPSAARRGRTSGPWPGTWGERWGSAGT
jgi:hypothetical protein